MIKRSCMGIAYLGAAPQWSLRPFSPPDAFVAPCAPRPAPAFPLFLGVLWFQIQ